LTLHLKQALAKRLQSRAARQKTGSTHLVNCAFQAMSLHRKKEVKETQKTFAFNLGRRAISIDLRV
jgi:hypothetical protein